MASCAIATCRNDQRNSSRVEGKSFHRFPKDKKVMKIWTSKCSRLDNVNVTTARICSDHFSESDFERDMMSELMGLNRPRKLKIDAVPSLNLPTARRSGPAALERKRRMETRDNHAKRIKLIGERVT